MGPNRKLVCFTFLVLTTLRGGAAAGMAAPESAEAPMAHMEQGTLSDFGFYQFWFNVGNFWLCQLFPATVNDTLITFPWNVFRLNPQIQTKVKIQVCTRAEIGSCQYYGTVIANELSTTEFRGICGNGNFDGAVCCCYTQCCTAEKEIN